MKQVFLSGQGQVEVFDAPVPGRFRGSILVRNAYSLISAGTEGAAVTKERGIKGLYEKVLSSRDRLDQVWSMVQTQGLAPTMELIRNKLADFTPLGYSSAGVILEVDDKNVGFKPGQRIVCMGTGFANHAEYVAVPSNLAVQVPDNVPLDQASFGAITCIAMQGIRRLELSPGERIAVVGLGLIGQVALRLATVMGYEAYGIDINERRVTHAREFVKAKAVFNSMASDPVTALRDFTDGAGVDGIVICASGKSDEIINQAFNMCRQRGRVSIVGDVGLGLERARMYAKELEVRLSCSYGVGRYDPEYEIEGRDYPLPHVRWTERRNLEYFIRLLSDGVLDLSDLITAKIGIEAAKEAYSKIKSGGNIYGVILDYHVPEAPALPQNAFVSHYETVVPVESESVRIGLIGVGVYAKNVHVPNLQKIGCAHIEAVASRTGASAAVVAKKTKAAYATSDVGELFKDDKIDAVVISTRHASHTRFVLDALASGKHVFVEKPMATTVQDCLRIVAAQQKNQCVVRVGYNRRFAPYLTAMKAAVGSGRRMLTIRVNVGDIGNHWSNTEEEGGRLLGEGVHFFDLANWVMECAPVSVSAQFSGEADRLNPDVSINIGYEDGSVANVIYTTVGHTNLGKERYELLGSGRAVVVDEYRSIEAFGCNAKVARGSRGDKGQLGAMREFVEAVRTGATRDGADAHAGLLATAVSEAAVISGREERVVKLDELIMPVKR